MSTSRPSIAEIRAVAQAGVIERRSAEHWAGRLYMRAISGHVTRLLITTPVTPNALTLSMIVVGLVAAAVITMPTLPAAVLGAALVQFYLLLDCVDGEVARWKRITSAAGVYLDRLGHHVVEGAIVVALGFRAAGGLSSTPSWWMVAGGITALVVIIGKLESDLVVVARAGAGLPVGHTTDPVSKVGSVRSLRKVFALVPIHRLVGAIELSLLLLVAAGIDALRGDLRATQALLVATSAVSLLVAFGHPVTILTSQKLK